MPKKLPDGGYSSSVSSSGLKVLMSISAPLPARSAARGSWWSAGGACGRVVVHRGLVGLHIDQHITAKVFIPDKGHASIGFAVVGVLDWYSGRDLVFQDSDGTYLTYSPQKSRSVDVSYQNKETKDYALSFNTEDDVKKIIKWGSESSGICKTSECCF